MSSDVCALSLPQCLQYLLPRGFLSLSGVGEQTLLHRRGSRNILKTSPLLRRMHFVEWYEPYDVLSVVEGDTGRDALLFAVSIMCRRVEHMDVP